MGRWQPNARERLREAALELFVERGYDRTTVEEIAGRAGLTERTFFRYFADKREVLFGRSGELQAFIAQTIAGAPEGLAPLDVVGVTLDAMASVLQQSRERARLRRKLIAAHAELRERELIKLTSLAEAMVDGLRGRGVSDTAARLTAEAGMALFKVGWERWIDDSGDRDLVHHFHAAADELKSIVTATGSAGASRPAKAPRTRSPRRRTTG